MSGHIRGRGKAQMNVSGLISACLRAWGRLAFCCVVVVGLPGTFSYAQDASERDVSKAAHLGVQTCASSTCHGAVQPWQNSSVLQNEYVTWFKHDAHAKAYKTLLSDKSKLIAKILGIGAAHKSPVCLQCHSDNVPQSQRAKFFKIEDGVSCETCHGGAE